ncbi:MAG TPA: UbiA-like polyprenyltransferase [bacterium]|jgi:4-hydroxybenzoate polyprenyltransferase|nr:UbiA-like polyprenyltransferase [bacterium]
MLKKIIGFIKLEHMLFSLPMLLAGAALSRPWMGWGLIHWRSLVFIVLAGAGARTAALALNRLLDRAIDARNPRTAGRELPSGKLSPAQGWGIAAGGTALYLVSVAALRTWLLWLAPIPLIIFVLYPLMKRFTWTCHFGVGLGLALAPLGGALGYNPDLDIATPVLWLALFTFFWVSGFDVLYATLDEEFDIAEGLFSVPAKMGPGMAQDLGMVLHGAALLCLGGLANDTLVPMAGPLAWAALTPAAILLLLEQRFGYSLEPGSPFFTVNAWIGVAVAAAVLVCVR